MAGKHTHIITTDEPEITVTAGAGGYSKLYHIVPRHAFRRLKGPAQRIYCILNSLANEDRTGRNVFSASVREIAAYCGCNTNTVSRGIKDLLQNRLLVVVKDADFKSQEATWYQLLIPPSDFALSDATPSPKRRHPRHQNGDGSGSKTVAPPVSKMETYKEEYKSLRSRLASLGVGEPSLSRIATDPDRDRLLLVEEFEWRLKAGRPAKPGEIVNAVRSGREPDPDFLRHLEKAEQSSRAARAKAESDQKAQKQDRDILEHERIVDEAYASMSESDLHSIAEEVLNDPELQGFFRGEESSPPYSPRLTRLIKARISQHVRLQDH